VGDISYSVDAEDNLIDFSSNWDEIASEADTQSVMSDNITGKPLREFIQGDPTKMYVETILSFARSSQKPLIRQYRCDTPTHQRKMQMEVIPSKDGAVKLNHTLLSKTPWNKSGTIVHKNSTMLLRCSICNDIEYQNQWITQDDLLLLMSDYERTPIEVDYIVCPRCLKDITKFQKRNLDG
jgi:hypothetical protein